MKGIAVFLSVANIAGVLSFTTIPFQLREITNESIWNGGEQRIYGGREAADNQFPHMVFALIKLPDNRLSQCSASLLRPNWVLLAAHCVYHKNLKAKDILLVAGKVKLKEYVIERLVMDYNAAINEAKFGLQERRAKAFVYHPNYNDQTLVHDVALIQLETPFNLNKVDTIPLSEDEIKSPKDCTILGWGLTLGNVQNFILNYVTQKRVKTTKLGCIAKPSGPFICLTPDGTGICQGDSGSPLVCDGKVWGVASHFVSRTQNPNCGDSVEEYYTELHPDLNWLKKTMDNGSFRSVVFNTKTILLGAVVSLMFSIKL